MKRVNIGLKEETHTAAKLISIIKKVPLGKYLEEAVEQAIEKDKDLLKKIRP